MKRVWRCSWRPRSSGHRHAHPSHNRSILEQYLEGFGQVTIVLNAVNPDAVNLEAVDREACAMEADTLSIG